MERLPTDLAAYIACHVAATAADPMEDLRNLRATSRQMRRVCAQGAVGRSVALTRVLQRGTWEPYYDHDYLATLTTRLASVGNPEACFRLGLPAVFVADRGSLTTLVGMLERAAAGGHDVAAFVLSMVLYRSNTGAVDDDSARRLLAKVEGDEAAASGTGTWKNKMCTRRLCEALQVLQQVKADVHRLPHPVPRQDGHHRCRGGGCGEPTGMEGWYTWSTFCSEECRIRHETNRFFGAFW